MKAKFFILPIMLLSFVSCEHRDSTTNTRGDNVRTDVDNTGRNVRDRDLSTITPGDQAENEKDRTIVQAIRRAIMNDNSLSNNAKNVKIMSINGVVTLRGVVNSAQEKDLVGRLASGVSGIARVDNQLEIVQNP